MENSVITFQDLIIRLQEFWAKHGCSVLQPIDMEVGAGTFHATTFLKAIGPEPWNVAFVQPCRRPADGRYGDNPNRGQHYYQFQVMLKPSPENIQEIYLDSLRALGIDPLTDDIRFVEDNWESPTLGAVCSESNAVFLSAACIEVKKIRKKQVQHTSKISFFITIPLNNYCSSIKHYH